MKKNEKIERRTKLLSVKQVAKEYNFPQAKLYRYVKEGKVPVVKTMNSSGDISILINSNTFEEWLDEISRKNIIL